MNSNRLMIMATLFLASAGAAHATRNPVPPPSGIVIHLFGPDSIMSKVAPGLPGETPSQPVPAQPSNGTTSAAAGTEASTPSVQNSDNPGWHAVLHQMFVVGDPNDPNKLAPGRAAERENVQ